MKTKAFILSALIVIILSGCSLDNKNKTDKLYQNNDYNFSLRYSSDWEVGENSTSEVFFTKKPLTLADVNKGKVSEKDCIIHFLSLNNSQDKPLEDFWKKLTNDQTRVKIGDNEFLRVTFKSDNPNNISYTIASKNKVFLFNTNKNTGCISEEEKILGTLKLN